VPSKIDSPIWGMMISVGMHSSLRGPVGAKISWARRVSLLPDYKSRAL